MAVFMTRNFRMFMYRYHREELVLLALGRKDVLTDEIWQEYLDWCQSEEADPYFYRKVVTQ